MLQGFGDVATPLLTAADAGTLISSISGQLVANLPFIVAIVGFSIIAGMVIKKIHHPVGK